LFDSISKYIAATIVHIMKNSQNGTEDVHSNIVIGVKHVAITLITKGNIIPNTITHNRYMIALMVVLIIMVLNV
jgi:hypothetical protein